MPKDGTDAYASRAGSETMASISRVTLRPSLQNAITSARTVFEVSEIGKSDVYNPLVRTRNEKINLHVSPGISAIVRKGFRY